MLELPIASMKPFALALVALILVTSLAAMMTFGDHRSGGFDNDIFSDVGQLFSFCGYLKFTFIKTTFRQFNSVNIDLDLVSTAFSNVAIALGKVFDPGEITALEMGILLCILTVKVRKKIVVLKSSPVSLIYKSAGFKKNQIIAIFGVNRWK